MSVNVSGWHFSHQQSGLPPGFSIRTSGMVASGEREKALRIPGFNRHAGIRAVGDRRDGSIAVAFPFPRLQKIADPAMKMLVRRMLLCMRFGESLFSCVGKRT
ncbi:MULTISPECIES: hypothetical protein [Paraburkholderia]|uniref:hypothetical protein n=1 Tax=Paraburkholderia TaxID=1822464 RepID=UPI0013A6894B|nr:MULTISPECIES: hypothetical protein [Paraburkholderia]MDH6150507.1 hypothetical protein [Paraburkholderia sp. WSM4179]